MRTFVLGLVVLLAVAGAARADEAKLKEEINTLRNEKAVLEAKIKLLTERLDRMETDVRKIRLDMARDIQEMSERLAKLDSGPRVAVRPDPVRPETGTKVAVTPPPTTPSVTTPSITPGKTTDPVKGTVTTPTIAPPPTTRPTDPPALTRNDLPRIPDPVLPGTPIRTRPKVDRPKGTPTTVAMVDMLHLWNSLKEKQSIEDGLADLVYAVQFTDQTWQKKIREYELDFHLLAQGSEAWIEKKRQIENAYIERNVAIRAAQSKLNRRRGELTKLLYTKMVDSIGRVADENGYDAVLFKESEPNYSKITSINDLFTDRMVVLGTESVDLSEQVIRMMNRDFERQLSSGN